MRIIEWLVTKLERRRPISELVDVDDLVLSNASLEDIKRGINKIYKEVNGGLDMESTVKYTERELEQMKLFEEIIALKRQVQSMASIVQNPMEDAPDYIFDEWNESVNKLINNINSLKMDVLDFYNKR